MPGQRQSVRQPAIAARQHRQRRQRPRPIPRRRRAGRPPERGLTWKKPAPGACRSRRSCVRSGQSLILQQAHFPAQMGLGQSRRRRPLRPKRLGRVDRHGGCGSRSGRGRSQRGDRVHARQRIGPADQAGREPARTQGAKLVLKPRPPAQRQRVAGLQHGRAFCAGAPGTSPAISPASRQHGRDHGAFAMPRSSPWPRRSIPCPWLGRPYPPVGRDVPPPQASHRSGLRWDRPGAET